MQEIEILLQSVSKHRKYIQDRILANFYTCYCNPDIECNWNDFELLADITGQLFPLDLMELQKIYEVKMYSDNDFDSYAIGRLNKLGLVDYLGGIAVADDHAEPAEMYYAKINSIGEFYWDKGMKGISLISDVDGEEWII